MFPRSFPAPRAIASMVSLLLTASLTSVSAGERNLEEGVAKRESPDASGPGFTWRRDRPYGEIGFPGDEFGPHWEFLRLATWPTVQEELDLTPEQVASLKPVLKALMATDGAWSRGREHPDFLRSAYDEARRVLSEEQAMRVEQIKFQRRGMQAFLHADVQETLGLSPEQIETIRSAWKIHVANAEDGWKGDEGRRSYHRVWKLALETLTPAQRQKLYAQTGPLVAAARDE